MLSAQGLPSQLDLEDYSLLPAQDLPDTQVHRVTCKIAWTFGRIGLLSQR